MPLQRLAAVIVLALALGPAATASASSPVPHAPEQVASGPGSHPIVQKTDQMGAARLRPRLAATAAVSTSTIAGPAPFLTRPYWGSHPVTSIFDHCNPDYTRDGRICEFDGTVALASNGHDPYFPAGYPTSPGGTDYLYYDGHNGWDLALDYENLIAAADGAVDLAGSDPFNPGFGQTVTINHPNGYTTRYAHMSSISVASGQRVHRGDTIGVSGNTGASTGPHLHFGVYITSTWTAIDPWGWTGGYADPWPADQGNLWLTGNPQDPVPWAPTGVTAALATGGVKVSWVPPSFTGGPPLTSYTITSKPPGTTGTAPAGTTSAMVSGLGPDLSYTFTVSAGNAVGGGPGSAPSNSVVTPGPAAVTFAALPGTSSSTDIQLSWSTPLPGTYDLDFSEDGRGPFPWLTGISASNARFFGMAGHSYSFKVTAHVQGFTAESSSAAVAVAAQAATPYPVKAVYLAQATGEILPVASQPATGAPHYGWDIARAIALLPGGDGGYELDGFGGLHPFGSAPPANGAAYFGWDIARDVAILPSGSGGYVLDGWGALHPFGIGDSPPPTVLGGGGYWPGWDIAHRMVLASDGQGGYLLDGYGGLHPLGNAPAVTVGPYFGWDIARNLVLLPGTHSGYLLDGYGGVHPVSADLAAPAAVSQGDYWHGRDLSRGLLLADTATAATPAGWKVDASGVLHPFGSPPSIPPASVTGPVRAAASQ